MGCSRILIIDWYYRDWWQIWSESVCGNWAGIAIAAPAVVVATTVQDANSDFMYRKIN